MMLNDLVLKRASRKGFGLFGDIFNSTRCLLVYFSVSM